MNAMQFRTQLEHLWATRPARPAAPRTVAGVCAGIAARYRVDPTLVKVAFVVATVFGGSGLLLYIAAWICCPSSSRVVPSTTTPRRLPARAIAGSATAGSPSRILLWVAIAILVTTFVTAGRWGSGGLVGAVLMLVGWWLLYLRTPDAPLDTSALLMSPAPDRFERWTPRALRTGTVPRPSAAVDLTKSAAALAVTDEFATSAPTPAAVYASRDAGVTPSQNPTATHSDSSNHRGPEGFTTDIIDEAPPAWDPLGAARFAWDLPDPPTPQQNVPAPERRAPVTLIVAGVAILAAALGTALNRFGVTWFSVAHTAALALAVIGGGLIVGGLLRKRPRAVGLVPIAILLGVFVVVATTLTTWNPDDKNLGLPAGGVGERNWKPVSENDIRDSYSLSIGRINLDLSGITLTSDRTVDLRNGIGEIAVTVPETMTIRAECSSGIGDYTCPEGLSAGTRPGPVLTIIAHSGAGNVEVSR